MEDQLQAEPHEAARSRMLARAPTDDDADGDLECSSAPEDNWHRGSKMPKVLLAVFSARNSIPEKIAPASSDRTARDTLLSFSFRAALRAIAKCWKTEIRRLLGVSESKADLQTSTRLTIDT